MTSAIVTQTCGAMLAFWRTTHYLASGQRQRQRRIKGGEEVAQRQTQTLGAMGTVTVLSCLQVCHTSQVTILSKHSATTLPFLTHSRSALLLFCSAARKVRSPRECYLCLLYHLSLPELEMAPRGILWRAVSVNGLVPLNGAEVDCVEVFGDVGCCFCEGAE